MSLVVVGLNERDAPLEVLEAVNVAGPDLAKALSSLCESPHVAEAVVLSTCLRTEVYAVLERFHDGLGDIERFFSERLDPAQGERLAEQLVIAFDDAAAQHLFRVASGVDSAVLGESEILGQVKRAAARAHAERAAGPVLGGLFRHAVEVGKRARAETAIARGTVSLAHVAVDLAAARNGGDLSGSRVLVVGAGEMGDGILSALAARPDRPELLVANRSLERARLLAERLGATPARLEDVAGELTLADVIITATAGSELVIDAASVRATLPERRRPLLLIDTAVPRDVDPALSQVPGVELLDLDDLRRFAESEMAARRGEVARVEEIVEAELERYRVNSRARTVAPLVAGLRAWAEGVRSDEVERERARLERLGPEAALLVEQLSQRLVQKLLHEPTVQLKLAAGTPKGERLAEALRALYDL